MSDQGSVSPSRLPSRISTESPTNPSQSPNVLLYERVRLQSFQSFLHGTVGKHPRVLLEDLLKAEVLSSKLVLAIEDLVNSLLNMLDKRKHVTEDYGMSSTTEDESIRSFRSALRNSVNALEGITNLKISEEMKHTMSSKTSEHSLSMTQDNQELNVENYSKENHRAMKISLHSSESTTPGNEKSSSLSTRGFNSTSSSDHTSGEHATVSGGEESRGLEDVSRLHDAVLKLRDEIEDLERQQEAQFIMFASKIMDTKQDHGLNVRQILEKIVQKLSPQDQNWTFQARLNEGDMEQLFYFVLLQKTLKSCLVVMNSITLPELHDLNIDAETDNDKHDGKIQLCSMCERGFIAKESGKCAADETLLKTSKQPFNFNSSDSNDEQQNSSAKTSLKRPNEFDDEQKHKKRRKSYLLSCFAGKWMRKRRSKKLRLNSQK
ncbi:uncharacterized protein LOC124443867 [Xenia sp. Carnegie-2017]|uniref:uncharacterized protein LOC124443867 n=1 Tax=Xenia sp. Carnegie-2017 TaxID=2897299 RepID=UPI001F0439AE|nr:uncharacterized protein LOC124443867 [Xenia sp. Carnegie-2017]XP_046850367.1 uncharacterized protein LOC124443867 [Xenia sp. Carnegie-2017]